MSSKKLQTTKISLYLFNCNVSILLWGQSASVRIAILLSSRGGAGGDRLWRTVSGSTALPPNDTDIVYGSWGDRTTKHSYYINLSLFGTRNTTVARDLRSGPARLYVTYKYRWDIQPWYNNNSLRFCTLTQITASRYLSIYTGFTITNSSSRLVPPKRRLRRRSARGTTSIFKS